MEEQTQHDADGHANRAVHESSPELVEVLQKRHFPAGFELKIVFVVGRTLNGGRLRAGEGHEGH
jgi:hypothetical protein